MSGASQKLQLVMFALPVSLSALCPKGLLRSFTSPKLDGDDGGLSSWSKVGTVSVSYEYYKYTPGWASPASYIAIVRASM